MARVYWSQIVMDIPHTIGQFDFDAEKAKEPYLGILLKWCGEAGQGDWLVGPDEAFLDDDNLLFFTAGRDGGHDAVHFMIVFR